MEAGAQGRQALRPRRRRRRLCDLRLAVPRCWRCSEQKRAARPLRGPDRGVRGIGSYDLPSYVDHLRSASASRRWWCASTPAAATTTSCGSPRRCAASPAGTLTVQVLTEGVHSGDASGIVPSSLPHPAPAALAHRGRDHRRDQARRSSTSRSRRSASSRRRPPRRCWATTVYDKFPFAGGDAADGRRSGRAGAEPHLAAAARGHRRGRLSGAGERRQRAAALLHAPSSACACRRRSTAKAAMASIKKALEADPPYGARSTFERQGGQTGWNAPPLAPWLEKAVDAGLRGGVRHAGRLHGRRRHRSPSWACWARSSRRRSS